MALDVPEWLNSKFLEKVWRNWSKNESVSIKNVNVTAPTADGDNYSSEMYRAHFESTIYENNKEITEKRSVIIKKILKEGEYKKICEKYGIFDTEITMMTSTLKEMQLLLDDVKLCGECYYAQYKDPPFLVIEDLTPLGFSMAERRKGLDLQHCLFAMRGLANFHATSFFLCKKNPQLKDKHNRGIFSATAPSEWIDTLSNTMKNFKKTVKRWNTVDETCKNKIIKSCDDVCQKNTILMLPNESEFNVINHGDFWTNNMLFRHDQQGHPIDIIFVDFQYCVYGSPAIDLQYFLNTSPSDEVFANHRDKLIEQYYKTLCETMKKINCEVEPPTVNDLKIYMRKLELYGFEAAGITLPMALSRKDEITEETFDGEILDEFEKKRNTPEYIKTMSRRLNYWNEIGLFDE